MAGSGGEQGRAIHPRDLERFRRAFLNRNETLIAAGNPALSAETRALKLDACRPEQRPHAGAAHAFAERLGALDAILAAGGVGDVGKVGNDGNDGNDGDAEGSPDSPDVREARDAAGAPSLAAFIDELRPLFAAARLAADMPEAGGVAAALVVLGGEGESAPGPGPGMVPLSPVEGGGASRLPAGARRYHALMRAARDCLLPVERGYPCAPGWRHRPPRSEIRPYFIAAGMPTPRSGRVPMGVTWHRAGGAGLDSVRRRFASEIREESRASTHYCIGADFADGIERYVSIEDRAWHAGTRQILRWDGRACALRTRRGHEWINEGWKAARTTIGVTVVGFAEPITRREQGEVWDDVPPEQILHAAMPNGQGRRVLRFGDEQYEMMIAVGREIVERWPHLRPWSHHGHYDICPDYRWDPLGLDFARLLRGVYPEDAIPDVWTPLRTAAQRQRVMKRLCGLLGIKRRVVVDGIWGVASRTTLRALQRAMAERKNRRRPGLFGRWRAALATPEIEMLEARPMPAHTAVNGYWTSFTNWDVHAVLGEHGVDLAEAAGPAAADPPEEGPDEIDRRRRR